MTTPADQPDPNLPRLSPADAELLDRWLGRTSADHAITTSDEARVRDMLALLDRWHVGEPEPGLTHRALARVVTAAPARLCEADGAALDALLALHAQGLAEGPMPSDTRARAERVSGLLGLLDRARKADTPVPAGLTERTMRAVEYECSAEQRLSISAAGDSGRWRASGGSIRQIATTAALLMMVLSVLLPVLDKSRRDAMITQCEQNLAGLGVDLQRFASDNKESVKAPAQPPAIFSHLSEFASRDIDGSRVPASSVSLFVLLNERNQQLTSEHLACPAAENGSPTAFYNGQNPVAGGPLRVFLQPRPIFADTNPLYRLTPNGLVRDADIPGMTRSKNHDGVGQNVLISDGSVAWKVRPAVTRSGLDSEDNIWLFQPKARTDKGDSEPDVFLTP